MVASQWPPRSPTAPKAPPRSGDRDPHSFGVQESTFILQAAPFKASALEFLHTARQPLGSPHSFCARHRSIAIRPCWLVVGAKQQSRFWRQDVETIRPHRLEYAIGKSLRTFRAPECLILVSRLLYYWCPQLLCQVSRHPHRPRLHRPSSRLIQTAANSNSPAGLLAKPRQAISRQAPTRTRCGLQRSSLPLRLSGRQPSNRRRSSASPRSFIAKPATSPKKDSSPLRNWS